MKINSKIVDLTHSLEENIPTWDKTKGFNISISCNYANCIEPNTFQINKLEMNAGIGTHIDAPSHIIPGGKNIDELEIENLILSCVVIDLSEKINANYIVTEQDIINFEKENGLIPEKSFVIFYTGWEKYWNDKEKYINDHQFPSLDISVAKILLERNIAGIGTDTLSVDTGKDGFPVHIEILKNNKFLVENIKNASLLPKIGAEIFIAPIKIKNATEAPIRLFAKF